MRSFKRMAIIPAALAACGIATGCISYHKTVDETQPAVVEAVPAPAPALVAVPAPVVTAPVTSSSTTTTTTDTAPAVVERQKTTTYTTPY